MEKKQKSTRIVNFVGDEPDAKPIGEDFPFFGRRTTSRRGCGLTICLTFLVICAAAAVVVVSVLIAHKEQISAELLLDIKSVDADFAFWDPSTQILFWVDRELNKLHMYEPAFNVTSSMQINHTIGVVMPRIQYNDSVIITSGNYVATLNLTTGEEEIITYFNQTNWNTTSFTDGRCDPSGYLWTGTAGGDLVTDGVLYKVQPPIVPNTDSDTDEELQSTNDQSTNYDQFTNDQTTNNETTTISAMLKNITTPGGMAWSHDKKTFFFIDSKNSRVNAYTYIAGEQLVFLRVAFVVPSQYGTLSGMTIDITDSLWIAIIGPPTQNNSGRVCRYDPFLGQLQVTIQLPVSQVTSCVFGGPNLDQLYITTRKKDGEANSGGIYVAKQLGVTGAYPSLYSG